jgi:peptidoglycan/LPS O-acetylase OafA/YrhL
VNAPPSAAVDSRRATLHYLPGLDGIRAISVLAVLVYHQYAVGGHEHGWMAGGFLGVEVFFVVSGYLITSLLLAERRQTGTISLRHFYQRRARRLLPALYVLLAVVVAYALLFLPDSISNLKSDVIAALTYTSNWWQIIANRSYFLEAGRPSLLKHLWSLAIEEQFYLFWPVVLMFGLRKIGRRRFLIFTVLAAVASCIEMAVLAHGSFDRAYYGTDTRLSGLLLGSAFAFAFAPYRIRGVPGRGARVALDLSALLGLLILFWSFRHWNDANPAVFRGGFFLVDVATLLVIAAAVHPRSDTGRLLGWRPLRWVGVRSYSLYLWHYPIFCVTRPVLDFRYFAHLSGWPVFVLRFVLSFGAADLSYRFIETPIRGGALGRYMSRVREAHGMRRTRLAGRGALVAASLSLVALLLGAGLANAQPQTEKVFGVDSSARHDDRGEKPDASVVSSLRSRATSSTTTSRSPTVTQPTPTTKKPTVATKAAPPKATGPPPQALAIGDSVMLGARRSLAAAIPGIAVDAKVSRQFWQAVDVLTYYRNANLLPSVVIIHLGTNGKFGPRSFDTLMRAAGFRKVFFVNAHVPRPWEGDVNAALAAGAQRWHNARVLDWHAYASKHLDWFAPDGFHLSRVGAQAYAQFVRSGIS